MELLTWSGEGWLLPRAYTDLLDRGQRVEGDLLARARECSGCGALDPDVWGGWRTPTKTGYVTLCPPCSGATFQPYTGHLRGVLYDSARRRRTQPDDYVCALCQARQAAGWDHCHDHDYLRGPLCAGCNTSEGSGLPYYFLQRDEGARYLLECKGCRDQRTLPLRFHSAVVRLHLEQTEQHGTCDRQPYAGEGHQTHGVRRFELNCTWHTRGRWARDVTAAETTALVQAVVDAALTTTTPPPCDGIGGSHP
ncbi:endonuclease domain-containing protein [Streptomyces sp. H10-C2]|uniref:endonuclease domain-containing protein n=1 Tax=unclassified Streptomyces TaxID=2593676 RepID=UPI0024BBDBDA|nr:MULTISPECIES: endonuclease domain-containing protein [unclassified Streptomyces]MDJ0346966.1 endonuclease domain-containing protein [Streptomyces sp. PH10-H1]MDJ0374631.1 endonuclease domain-containing protein [Streptomyces sp. H10-C2]